MRTALHLPARKNKNKKKRRQRLLFVKLTKNTADTQKWVPWVLKGACGNMIPHTYPMIPSK